MLYALIAAVRVLGAGGIKLGLQDKQKLRNSVSKPVPSFFHSSQ